MIMKIFSWIFYCVGFILFLANIQRINFADELIIEGFNLFMLKISFIFMPLINGLLEQNKEEVVE